MYADANKKLKVKDVNKRTPTSKWSRMKQKSQS